MSSARWIGVCVAAGLCSACAAPQADDQAVLSGLRADYEAGRLAGLDARLTPLCDPRRPEAAEALYLRGLARVAVGRHAGSVATADQYFEAARIDLEAADQLARREGDVRLIRYAQAALGHVHFHKRLADYPRAAAHYRAALPPEPEWRSEPDIDELLFHLGVAEQRSGDWESAVGHLTSAVTARPGGRYDARARSHLSAGAFSIQVGSFVSPENAADQRTRLARQGVAASVEYRPTTAGARHIVKVGRWRTYGEAVAALPQVKAALRPLSPGRDPEAFVVP
jgi:tetratricopeptide (TPR) repeat protein